MEHEAKSNAAARADRWRKDKKNAAARAKRAAARAERERILEGQPESRAVTSREKNEPVRAEPSAPCSDPMHPWDACTKPRPIEHIRAATLPPIDVLTAPVPCPFCDKLFPGVYGQPGVARLRADNETLICAECGTREALEGGLKMPVWKFLETYTDSHGIYLADAIAKRFLLFTGHKAPWAPTNATELRRQIAARGLGGSYEGNDAGVAGYVMAEACAWEFARFHSVKHGRGYRFRECIEALRGNGV